MFLRLCGAPLFGVQRPLLPATYEIFRVRDRWRKIEDEVRISHEKRRHNPLITITALEFTGENHQELLYDFVSSTYSIRKKM